MEEVKNMAIKLPFQSGVAPSHLPDHEAICPGHTVLSREPKDTRTKREREV